MTTPALLLNGPTPAWDDQDLVRECLRGNQHAWAAIVEKYKDLVYSAPAGYHMPHQDAADVFQEVWVELYTRLPDLRDIGALRGWLMKVAWHKCYQWKVRRQRWVSPSGEVEREPVDGAPSFLEWKQEAERLQVLREAVAALPDRCRRLVEMLFFQDPPLPYSDVARQLGLAEGSIGFIRGRCLRKLRSVLEERQF